MKRKVTGIIGAVVLALIGTIVLASYVKKAKDDAVAKEEQVSVYVVTKPINRGTTVAELRDNVSLESVPKRLKAADAVTDLDQLDQSLVAAVNLLPAEQLLASRLVPVRALSEVAVPDGLQQVTVALDPQRAVGGLLQPGDFVGVVLSFDPVAATASATGGSVPDRTPNSTHLTLTKVLVTAVRLSKNDASRASEIQSTGSTLAPNVDEGPSDQLLVTLAVSAADAEQIVFAAEFGHIWLTAQTPSTDDNGTRIVTIDQAYVTVEQK